MSQQKSPRQQFINQIKDLDEVALNALLNDIEKSQKNYSILMSGGVTILFWGIVFKEPSCIFAGAGVTLLGAAMLKNPGLKHHWAQQYFAQRKQNQIEAEASRAWEDSLGLTEEKVPVRPTPNLETSLAPMPSSSTADMHEMQDQDTVSETAPSHSSKPEIKTSPPDARTKTTEITTSSNLKAITQKQKWLAAESQTSVLLSAARVAVEGVKTKSEIKSGQIAIQSAEHSIALLKQKFEHSSHRQEISRLIKRVKNLNQQLRKKQEAFQEQEKSAAKLRQQQEKLVKEQRQKLDNAIMDLSELFSQHQEPVPRENKPETSVSQEEKLSHANSKVVEVEAAKLIKEVEGQPAPRESKKTKKVKPKAVPPASNEESADGISAEKAEAKLAVDVNTAANPTTTTSSPTCPQMTLADKPRQEKVGGTFPDPGAFQETEKEEKKVIGVEMSSARCTPDRVSVHTSTNTADMVKALQSPQNLLRPAPNLPLLTLSNQPLLPTPSRFLLPIPSSASAQPFYVAQNRAAPKPATPFQMWTSPRHGHGHRQGLWTAAAHAAHLQDLTKMQTMLDQSKLSPEQMIEIQLGLNTAKQMLLGEPVPARVLETKAAAPSEALPAVVKEESPEKILLKLQNLIEKRFGDPTNPNKFKGLKTEAVINLMAEIIRKKADLQIAFMEKVAKGGPVDQALNLQFTAMMDKTRKIVNCFETLLNLADLNERSEAKGKEQLVDKITKALSPNSSKSNEQADFASPEVRSSGSSPKF